MENEIKSIGSEVISGESFSSGIGYVVIPSDLDRTVYLADCYKNHRVTIQTAQNGFINRVMISRDDLNWVEFPDNYTTLGTPVFYMVDPLNGSFYIVKTFASISEIGTGKENTFKIGRVIGTSLVEFTGNPEKGYLNIVVNNDTESKLNVNVLNKNNSGELNLNVKGTANLVATNSLNFSANGQYYVKVFDPQNPDSKSEITQLYNAIKCLVPAFEVTGSVLSIISEAKQSFKTTEFEVIAEEKTNFDTAAFSIKATNTATLETKVFEVKGADETKLGTKKISINGGTENFVLGQKLKTFLTQFLTELAATTVTVPGGAVPLNNAVQLGLYAQKIDDLLSQVGFIDK